MAEAVGHPSMFIPSWFFCSSRSPVYSWAHDLCWQRSPWSKLWFFQDSGMDARDCREGWALKNRCFQLWSYRRFLRVPWTTLRSNQSLLKEINPEYSLKGLLLKPKLQYPGHLVWRADSLGKTLMLGKTEAKWEEGGRGWDGWTASPTQWTWAWANSRRYSRGQYLLQQRTEEPGMLQPMGSQRLRMTQWLNNTVRGWRLYFGVPYH